MSGSGWNYFPSSASTSQNVYWNITYTYTPAKPAPVATIHMVKDERGNLKEEVRYT